MSIDLFNIRAHVVDALDDDVRKVTVSTTLAHIERLWMMGPELTVRLDYCCMEQKTFAPRHPHVDV